MNEKKSLTLEDLAVLSRLKNNADYRRFVQLLETTIYNLMVKITRLPARDPDLAIKKAFYDGEITAIRRIRKDIETASEKMEIYESRGGNAQKAGTKT